MNTAVQLLKHIVQTAGFDNKPTAASLLAFSGAVMTYRLDRCHLSVAWAERDLYVNQPGRQPLYVGLKKRLTYTVVTESHKRFISQNTSIFVNNLVFGDFNTIHKNISTLTLKKLFVQPA